MRSHAVYLSLTLLTTIPFATVAHASDDQGGTKECMKSLGAQGLPNPFSAVANLNAVRLWVEIARERYGPEFAMWHNASGKNIKCSAMKRSSQFKCFAKAKPCKADLEMKSGSGSGSTKTASN